THHAMGVVKKIDANAGIITIAHAPVKALGWPSMTMGFQVKDKMLLEHLSVDKAIEFDFQKGSNGYVLTAVK
ncbi:copper-binding protein, partial [Rhizobium ruizarguesonis]|uniref:copper-binding protein n=1 Tax=Rhizobium ruizarguesonis TaxID=2081791 RepID=UPI0013C81797